MCVCVCLCVHVCACVCVCVCLCLSLDMQLLSTNTCTPSRPAHTTNTLVQFALERIGRSVFPQDLNLSGFVHNSRFQLFNVIPPVCCLRSACVCCSLSRACVRECLFCAFVRVYVRACALGMSRAPMGVCEAEGRTEHLRCRSVAKHNATFMEPQRYPTVAHGQGHGHDRRLHGLYGLQDHAPFAPY